MIDYWKVFLVVVILPSTGAGADDEMMSRTNLRGSPLSPLPRNVLEEMAHASGDDDHVEVHDANSRRRKQDLFRARSNDFDDDVIAAYESSNDDSSFAKMAPSRASTPTDGLFSSASSTIDDDNESISSGGYHQAPSRSTGPIVSIDKQPELNSTTITPANNPSTAPTTEPATSNPLKDDLTPSYAPSSQPEYNDNTIIIARYHQDDVIAEANADEQLEGGAATSEELLPPSHSEQDLGTLSTKSNKKSEQIVPALLTGFASMVLFFALFLVCANQREQYIQRKWERKQIRIAALTDDGSCGRSARSSQAYSDPFDGVYGEEVGDGRSLYSRSSVRGGEGSEENGSYWVQAVVKRLADRNRNDETKHHQANILPPLDGEEEDNAADDDESSFAGLSLVSSLTQSLMTFGSALWPSEEASLDIGPSSRRVAAESKRSSVASSEKESLDGEDSAIAHLHQTNSNEDAGGSVCSSLTDGTSTTLKSEEFEETPVGRSGNSGVCMPAIDEDGVHDENNRRMSLYSPSKRKDISTDSTQTQSTILDDSSSLDLASELARLQNLIGSIDPGDDLYEHDMAFKSLSDESFDLGCAEGREEI